MALQFNIFTGNFNTRPDTPGIYPQQFAVGTAMQQLLLVGCYNQAGEPGLHTVRFDAATGAFTLLHSAPVDNPSHFALSSDRTRVWAVGENGPGTSLVNAVALDPLSGEMQPINSVAAHGEPCHITVLPGERMVATANYGGGTLGFFPVNKDGSLGEAAHLAPLPHHGSQGRQAQSRPHATIATPDGSRLLATNLGGDCIYSMPLPIAAGTPQPQVAATFPQGTGPRHMAWSPSGDVLYMIGEISDQVWALDGRTLAPLQPPLTVAPTPGQASADLAMHPRGEWLLASVRRGGPDGIAVLAVSMANGTLTPHSYCPTGAHPRSIAISPWGYWVLAACRDSGQLQSLAFDSKSGTLTARGAMALPGVVKVEFV